MDAVFSPHRLLSVHHPYCLLYLHFAFPLDTISGVTGENWSYRSLMRTHFVDLIFIQCLFIFLVTNVFAAVNMYLQSDESYQDVHKWWQLPKGVKCKGIPYLLFTLRATSSPLTTLLRALWKPTCFIVLPPCVHCRWSKHTDFVTNNNLC